MVSQVNIISVLNVKIGLVGKLKILKKLPLINFMSEKTISHFVLGTSKLYSVTVSHSLYIFSYQISF